MKELIFRFVYYIGILVFWKASNIVLDFFEHNTFALILTGVVFLIIIILWNDLYSYAKEKYLNKQKRTYFNIDKIKSKYYMRRRSDKLYAKNYIEVCVCGGGVAFFVLVVIKFHYEISIFIESYFLLFLLFLIVVAVFIKMFFVKLYKDINNDDYR